MIIAEPPVAPASAPHWIEQPSEAELALSRARYSRTDGRNVQLTMTCYVQADGRLVACQGEPALKRLAGQYRLDRKAYPAPTIVVQVSLPKISDTSVKLLSKPTPAQLKALGGKDRAVLNCRVSEVGEVSDCVADERAPPSAGVDLDIAKAGAALYRFKPAMLGGQAVATYVAFEVDLGGASHVINRPEWVRRPSGTDLMGSYPSEAYRRGISGFVRLHCRVTTSGAVTGCETLDEAPEGLGFGGSALHLAPLFVMKPQTEDGQPVSDGEVVIPLRFTTDGPVTALPPSLAVISTMAWVPLEAAPVASQVAAVFPPAAAAAHTFGRLVFDCKIGKDGALTPCEVQLNTSPRAGLDFAARRLLPLFKARIGAFPPDKLASLRTTVVFDFSARTLAADPDRYVRQLDWVRSFDADSVVKAYPKEAVEAGVLNGGATVECRIGADGTLTNCTSLQESAPNLGFGAAAVAVASVMQANLWTRDGEPAVGAKVKLPLKFVYAGEEAAKTP